MTEALGSPLPPHLEQRLETVLRAVCERGWTVATAESCTAGLVSAALSDVEGLGHALEAGFITYSDHAKSALLGVSRELIDRQGAVSEDVARAMAEAALGCCEADLAVSITGFAGPAGEGNEEGLVHFAVARRGGETAHREAHFGPRGRGGVRLACLETAVDMLGEAAAA